MIAPSHPLHLPPAGITTRPAPLGVCLPSQQGAMPPGRAPAPPVWHGLPTEQLWDLQRPKELLCLPTQSPAHWCVALKESLGRRGRCAGKGLSRAGPGAVSAGPSASAMGQGPSQPQEDSLPAGTCNFSIWLFSFSPSPALVCVCSLSFSLSPPLPSFPSPLIPNVACIVLALGVAWQYQGRVGAFPHCLASIGQPSTVCLVACVHVCVRVP